MKNKNPWLGMLPFPTPEEADAFGEKPPKPIPEPKPYSLEEQDVQDWTEAIFTALKEDGLTVEFFPYGKLASCLVYEGTEKFHVRVSFTNGTAVIVPDAVPLHYEKERTREIPLADPDVFKAIANHVRDYRPPVVDTPFGYKSVSERLDAAQRHQTQQVIGGYGHAFDVK